jgi:hypothetical protein
MEIEKNKINFFPILKGDQQLSQYDPFVLSIRVQHRVR